jgi:hypothetical protein
MGRSVWVVHAVVTRRVKRRFVFMVRRRTNPRAIDTLA